MDEVDEVEQIESNTKLVKEESIVDPTPKESQVEIREFSENENEQMDSWLPTDEDFRFPEFNSYDRGIGRNLKVKIDKNIKDDAIYNLFVSQIPSVFKEVGMFNLFLRYGEVKRAQIVNKDPNNRYGFVEYTKLHEAERAIRFLNRKEPYNLKVQFAKHREEPSFFLKPGMTETKNPSQENKSQEEEIKNSSLPDENTVDVIDKHENKTPLKEDVGIDEQIDPIPEAENLDPIKNTVPPLDKPSNSTEEIINENSSKVLYFTNEQEDEYLGCVSPKAKKMGSHKKKKERVLPENWDKNVLRIVHVPNKPLEQYICSIEEAFIEMEELIRKKESKQNRESQNGQLELNMNGLKEALSTTEVPEKISIAETCDNQNKDQNEQLELDMNGLKEALSTTEVPENISIAETCDNQNKELQEMNEPDEECSQYKAPKISQLEYWQMTSDSTEMVSVSYAFSPDLIYVQKVSSEDNLKILHQTMNDTCQLSPEYTPEVDDVCAVYNISLKSWMRACVIKILDKEVVNVLYIDIGSTDDIRLEMIHQISSQFLDDPIYALPSKIANIKPLEGSEWPTNSRQAFLSLFETGQHLLAKLLNIENQDLKGSKELLFEDQYGNDIGELLAKKGFASLKDDHKENFFENIPTPCMNSSVGLEPDLEEVHLTQSVENCQAIEECIDTFLIQTVPKIDLDVGEKTEIIFTDVWDYTALTGFLYKNIPQIKELQEKITKHCSKIPFDVSFKPKESELCLAFIQAHQLWKRVVVFDVDDEDEYLVVLVDSGEQLLISRENIRRITSSLLELPLQFLMLVPKGIKFIEEKSSIELINLLKAQESVEATISGKNDDLFDIDLQSLATELVEKGFAKYND